MEQTVQMQSSFAALFDPEVARALVERAAKWNLPRYICHPLDRYTGAKVNPALAAFDAEVDETLVEDEETLNMAIDADLQEH